MTKAIEDVTAERARQVEKEGWTPEHDDDHIGGDLATAGACYALADTGWLEDDGSLRMWPWENEAWKPRDRRRNLVRAAALIVAEIERLDRLSLEGTNLDRR